MASHNPKSLNHTPILIVPSTSSPKNRTLRAPFPSDIWRKPPNTETFNAPMLYQSLSISAFKTARATISADWSTLYDQGGLVLVLPPRKDGPGNEDGRRSWIKAGIEYYEGKARMSVVVADKWADWSLSELPGGGGRITVEIGRDDKGYFWVWVIGDGGKKMPVREVTALFYGVDEEAECWVGCFAARPTESADGGELEVLFEGFEVVDGS